MLCTMIRRHKTTILLAASLALLSFTGSSCRKSVDPEKLALSDESLGPAPNIANVIQIPKTAPPPVQPEPIAPQPPPQPTITSYNATILQHWLMLLGILLALFFFSLILFHIMGRRLHKRAFRAHAPTRHANIWASHKPPKFLDL